ncbi:MAG TPA: hypothetical protein VMF65_08425 [Acidimicrobiales bacterium]|nr:hypothetical protein [Acidimicrobiales bacterium]
MDRAVECTFPFACGAVALAGPVSAIIAGIERNIAVRPALWVTRFGARQGARL